MHNTVHSPSAPPSPLSIMQGTLRGALAGVLMACAACSLAPQPAPAKPATIVLVIIDTLRADHLSPYGYSRRPTTPHLDTRAESATVFDRAYSSSSWTLPAFGSVLTGRWPARHGAGAYSRTDDAGQWSSLDETLPTLAELLNEAGYSTAAIVNNLFLHERFGVARGYDRFDWRNGTDSTYRPASESVGLALSWLREGRAGYQFLTLHLMEPHFSYSAPGGYEGLFGRPGNPQRSLCHLPTGRISIGSRTR